MRGQSGHRRGPRFALQRLAAAALTGPSWTGTCRDQPFPVQLRRRLERLGPTYIKLGQILSLREDLLPRPITDELKHLLNQLPVVPLSVLRERSSNGTWAGPSTRCSWPSTRCRWDPPRSGRSTGPRLEDGEPVIIKVVKPGIRETLQRDARLLRMLGAVPAVVHPPLSAAPDGERVLRLHPARGGPAAGGGQRARPSPPISPDVPDVVFPAIYRALQRARTCSAMEFFDGAPARLARRPRPCPRSSERHLVDLGAVAIIRMIYQDGFFHADLHPGNLVDPRRAEGRVHRPGHGGPAGRRPPAGAAVLLLLPGDGRRRERGALPHGRGAEPGRGADPAGFRREVTEIATAGAGPPASRASPWAS